MQKLLLSLAFFIILFSSCTKDRDTTTPVAIAITSTTSTAGTVGSVFNYTINTNTIATSYAASGLPAGLSINSSTGVISGTPVNSGTYSVIVSATNANGTASATITITIGTIPTVLLHYWNFNDYNTILNQTTILPTSTIGGGNITFNANYCDTFTIAATTPNNNARNGDPAGFALRVRNPSSYLIIAAPTTNYKNIVLQYSVALSSATSAPLMDSIYYSTDGVNYIPVTTTIGQSPVSTTSAPLMLAADPSYTLLKYDFTTISAINNNPNAKFKIAFANGNTNTKGNTRFDNVTVDGVHQ